MFIKYCTTLFCTICWPLFCTTLFCTTCWQLFCTKLFCTICWPLFCTTQFCTICWPLFCTKCWPQPLATLACCAHVVAIRRKQGEVNIQYANSDGMNIYILNLSPWLILIVWILTAPTFLFGQYWRHGYLYLHLTAFHYTVSVLVSDKECTVKYSPSSVGVSKDKARGNSQRQRAILKRISQVKKHCQVEVQEKYF